MTFLTPFELAFTSSRSDLRLVVPHSMALAGSATSGLDSGGLPSKTTRPLSVPQPSALTGEAATGVAAAEPVAGEAVVAPAGDGAAVVVEGAATAGSGITTASPTSVPLPPQPASERSKA